MDLNNYLTVINKEPVTVVGYGDKVSFKSKHTPEGQESNGNTNYMFTIDG